MHDIPNWKAFKREVERSAGSDLLECDDDVLRGELDGMVQEMKASDAFWPDGWYEPLEDLWPTDPKEAVRAVLSWIAEAAREFLSKQMGSLSCIPWEMVGCTPSERARLISAAKQLRATAAPEVIAKLVAAAGKKAGVDDDREKLYSSSTG